MSTETHNALPFIGILEDGAGHLPGKEFAWLQDFRANGYARYAEVGLPTFRREEWKYTRLKTLEETGYRLSSTDDASRAVDVLPTVVETDQVYPRLVFVNGFFREDLSSRESLPGGVRCESFREAIDRDEIWLEKQLTAGNTSTDNPLVALNAAAMQDGFVLYVPKGVVIEGAIEIVFVSGLDDDAIAFFPRNVIVMEENTQVDVIVHQCSAGTGTCFANAVSSVHLGQNARLTLTTFQEEGTSTTAFSATTVHQERDSVFNSFALSSGGEISRHEQHVVLAGQGASCRLDGAYMMRGTSHCDHTTLVEHSVPETTSNEMFKGVLDDASRAVFQGKIIVHPDAQHTDGRMLNKTMLLSDKAEIDSKPELEIYADDVKCAHGATSGQVDKTALFYLQSRGIPEKLARSLLIQSFLGEVTERISDATVRDAVLSRIMSWLPEGSPEQ